MPLALIGLFFRGEDVRNDTLGILTGDSPTWVSLSETHSTAVDKLRGPTAQPAIARGIAPGQIRSHNFEKPQRGDLRAPRWGFSKRMITRNLKSRGDAPGYDR